MKSEVMTNEEAHRILSNGLVNAPSEHEWCMAFEMAIKALEQQPCEDVKTGYWVEENINEWSRKVFCSKCGYPAPFEHISNGDVYSASGYGVINKTKYCPNCGARMVEPQESEDNSIMEDKDERTKP